VRSEVQVLSHVPFRAPKFSHPSSALPCCRPDGRYGDAWVPIFEDYQNCFLKYFFRKQNLQIDGEFSEKYTKIKSFVPKFSHGKQNMNKKSPGLTKY
jgi:hypothetical protein